MSAVMEISASEEVYSALVLKGVHIWQEALCYLRQTALHLGSPEAAEWQRMQVAAAATAYEWFSAAYQHADSVPESATYPEWVLRLVTMRKSMALARYLEQRPIEALEELRWAYCIAEARLNQDDLAVARSSLLGLMAHLRAVTLDATGSEAWRLAIPITTRPADPLPLQGGSCGAQIAAASQATSSRPIVC